MNKNWACEHVVSLKDIDYRYVIKGCLNTEGGIESLSLSYCSAANNWEPKLLQINNNESLINSFVRLTNGPHWNENQFETAKQELLQKLNSLIKEKMVITTRKSAGCWAGYERVLPIYNSYLTKRNTRG
ncbi:MAG: hypothetical protein ACJ77K_19150 [Bacteroidia bacterium]